MCIKLRDCVQRVDESVGLLTFSQVCIQISHALNPVWRKKRGGEFPFVWQADPLVLLKCSQYLELGSQASTEGPLRNLKRVMVRTQEHGSSEQQTVW